jgi:hypothetical protein
MLSTFRCLNYASGFDAHQPVFPRNSSGVAQFQRLQMEPYPFFSFVDECCGHLAGNMPLLLENFRPVQGSVILSTPDFRTGFSPPPRWPYLTLVAKPRDARVTRRRGQELADETCICFHIKPLKVTTRGARHGESTHRFYFDPTVFDEHLQQHCASIFSRRNGPYMVDSAPCLPGLDGPGHIVAHNYPVHCLSVGYCNDEQGRRFSRDDKTCSVKINLINPLPNTDTPVTDHEWVWVGANLVRRSSVTSEVEVLKVSGPQCPLPLAFVDGLCTACDIVCAMHVPCLFADNLAVDAFA